MNSDRMESPVLVRLRSDGSNYSVWKGSMETSLMMVGLKRYIESDYSFNSSSTNSTMSPTHISDEQKNPVVVTGVSSTSTSSILSTSTPTSTTIQLEDQSKTLGLSSK